MNSATMFSSKTGNWNTPQSLIDDLSEVFDWDCDVCATDTNVCDFYYDEEDNGLGQNWLGLCWCNPPYGRQIGQWVQKASMHRYSAWFESKYFEIRIYKKGTMHLKFRSDRLWREFNIRAAIGRGWIGQGY